MISESVCIFIFAKEVTISITVFSVSTVNIVAIVIAVVQGKYITVILGSHKRYENAQIRDRLRI